MRLKAFAGKLAPLFAVVLALGVATNSAQAQDAGPPVKGGTLNVGFADDAKTLDPTFSVQWSERQILFLLFNTLLKISPDFSLQPELAKSWESLDGGKRVVLHLQEGVKFHDGTDFDAAAVKWNLERRMDEATKSPQRGQLTSIASIDVVDKNTVALTLKEPFPPLLSALADRAGFMISPASAEKYGQDLGAHPVGTGAFVLKEWVRGSHVSLDRNENYWEQGLPYLDHVVFNDISNAVVGIQRLMTGEIDFVAQLSPQDSRLVQNNPDIKLNPISRGQWYSFQWHWNEAPFDNAKLRKAIAHSIDREKINQILWAGVGTISNGPTPPGLWWSAPETKGYEYDVEKAKALLAEAGIKEGTEITLSAPSDNLLRQLDQLVKEQIEATGLKVTLDPVAQSEWYSRVVDRKINFTPMRWTQRADPDGLLYILFHSKGYANSTGYSNPEVDKLLDEARTLSDNTKRKALYDQVHAHLLEDLPYVPIAFAAEFAAMNKSVQGYEWIPDLIPRYRELWKSK
ncbi:peptide/nickel transport system substrate-binding protein [Rhodoligotrophos appendicifer]|uniref:ABC transporter substrate-binding protein n=1 Tax=Rhodoligotrophos appendicifer TaxID=987056 RepID=UPI00118579F4|nr:ABC transporter substrate-binding protein [Rhodoligotrophos appendicifer]